MSNKNYFLTKFQFVKDLSNKIKKFFVRLIFDHKKALRIQEVESDYHQ